MIAGALFNMFSEYIDKKGGSCVPFTAPLDVTLDDYSLKELCEAFPKTRIEPVKSGRDYYRALHDWENYRKERSGETDYMWQSNAGYTKY